MLPGAAKTSILVHPPEMVLNWRRTSWTMARAALPTLFMVMALNQ